MRHMIQEFAGKLFLYCSMAQCIDTSFSECTHLFFTDPAEEALLTRGAQPFCSKPMCCLYVGRIFHLCLLLKNAYNLRS